jgi:6-phosphogluconolactonase
VNLRVFDDAEALAHAAARAILQSNAKTIGVTGGSTPKRLYEILSESLPQGVTWVLVDERYVPRDDPRSNAAMIERTLFARGIPERWLPFDTSLNDPAETARAFEREWAACGAPASRRLAGRRPAAISEAAAPDAAEPAGETPALHAPELDLVLLGCGDDGHTASLFPGTPVLEVVDRIASEVFVPRLDQWRVTLTLPVLRAATKRIVLATGEAKAQVIREVREGAQHPIALATAGLDTWWFVDELAVGS